MLSELTTQQYVHLIIRNIIKRDKKYDIITACDQSEKSLLNVVHQLPQLVALAVIKELIKAKFDLIRSRARSQNLNSEGQKKLADLTQ